MSREAAPEVTTVQPDKACFPAVRAQISEGVDKLNTAAAILRRHGWNETADDVTRAVKIARFLIQTDGMLDVLETAKPWPEGVE